MEIVFCSGLGSPRSNRRLRELNCSDETRSVVRDDIWTSVGVDFRVDEKGT